MIPEIHIEDYNYPLPDERIAKYPLDERDSSKLLEYRDGKIREHIFRDLPSLIEPDGLFVFNDTKVVPARLFFRRETGAVIEIFCLEPVQPVEYNLIFASTESCRWKCIIGNAKKWKGDRLKSVNTLGDPAVEELDLTAVPVSRDGGTAVVEFSWKGGQPFSRVLEICGSVPIPPYLNRDTEAIDSERYQTLYARYRGSVAAPTAGLHFTDEVLRAIEAKGVDMEEVCLHVGAGTFLPVKDSLVSRHNMHREPFSVRRELIRRLRDCKSGVTAVGTTSVRTLESLYYLGLHCITDGEPGEVSQWEAYDDLPDVSFEESMDALLAYMDANALERLSSGTRIIIVPGFRFRIVEHLITNFHQPQSTLLLLISAFVGGDWKSIYNYALDNGFRFLSYGDSSLLHRR
ncbi:MAG: S-adenosylmethionine:tRNA ribosyltransferase-isomerase [Candidatus Cryptobacteroides sp.]